MKKNRLMRIVKMPMLLILICSVTLSFLLPALATGSKSLYPTQTLPATAKPYRPYTEWYNGTYASMPRHQIIKVYAKTGETIFFGSSTADSRYVDTTQTKDIKATFPAGNTSYYNVVSSGTGYIGSLAQETAGPRYTDNGVVKNSSGYTPLRIDVEQTGVYEFEFYSSYLTTAGNPSAAAVTDAWNTSSGGTVGAWDVTVVKNLGTAGGNGNSEKVPGRTFCNYLCMNMGANFFTDITNWGKGLYSSVYILTDDGYIYRTDFNGIDPFGFLFFANNRGLINPVSNTSLYHSARDTSNNMDALRATLIGADGNTTLQPTFHLPTAPDTLLDKTYKVFFEKPADDLPESVRATPYMPGKVTYFKFTGYETNKGYVGAGGWFSFNVNSGSSYQIKIEFADNYASTGRAANTLYLSNACVNGFNTIYWDGRDGNGDLVPAGVYGSGESDGSIKITIQVKAGEYHFPLLDVESNPFGVKIELINTPYKADGTLYTWSTPEAEKEARTKVYYDNSLIIGKGSQTDTTAVGGTTRGALWTAINNQLNALDGISSANGAARYMATASGNQNTLGGDYAFIDLWTYTIGDASSVESSIESFELEESSTAVTSQLKGLVYYDYDQATYSATTTYSILKGDYALKDVQVEIYNSSNTLVATAKTDSNGMYYVTGLTIGEAYSVRVYAPYTSSTFTTHNSGITTTATGKYLTFSQGPLSPALNTARNVGIHYDTYSKTLQVSKVWARTLAADPTRPSQISVSAVGSYNKIDYITVDVALNASNGWTNVFYNLPAKNDAGDMLEYRIEENGSEGYVSDISTEITDGGKTTLYTLTNTPREMTVIKQLTEPALSDQPFIFQVDGNTDGIAGTDCTFQIVLTVAAGDSSAYQTVTHLAEGVYTVTELDTNWRYTLVIADTVGKVNDVGTASPVGRSVTLPVSADADYYFIFKNQLVNSYWLDFNASVTNKMNTLT